MFMFMLVTISRVLEGGWYLIFEFVVVGRRVRGGGMCDFFCLFSRFWLWHMCGLY